VRSGAITDGAPSAERDYKAIYVKAIEARNRSRWTDAAALFKEAVSIKTDSDEMIAMPGSGAAEPYVPYYNLGEALRHMNDCKGALDAWDRAERAGELSKTKSSGGSRQALGSEPPWD
jgi:hypothetical protein